MKLSVIVPTYNERDSLPRLLTRLSHVQRGLSIEVVVVDDASPDGTGQLAEEFARERLLPIRVVHRGRKAGLASAVLDGAVAAQGGVVSVMDADLSHPPELLAELAARVDSGADIAIASRYVPGGGIEAWTWRRRGVSRAATWLARVVLRLRVRDPLSGFFAIRRELLTQARYMGIGYKLLMEILATHPEARVEEIPYRFVDREYGRSKLSSHEIVDYLRLLFRLRLKRGIWSLAHFSFPS